LHVVQDTLLPARKYQLISQMKEIIYYCLHIGPGIAYHSTL